MRKACRAGIVVYVLSEIVSSGQLGAESELNLRLAPA